MSDARDRLMDALLRQHLGEGSPQMEQRYARAFAALDAAEGSPLRNPTRARALRIARAALVVLCAGTMLLLLPVESNAMGVIASAASSRMSNSASFMRGSYGCRSIRMPRARVFIKSSMALASAPAARKAAISSAQSEMN